MISLPDVEHCLAQPGMWRHDGEAHMYCEGRGDMWAHLPNRWVPCGRDTSKAPLRDDE